MSFVRRLVSIALVFALLPVGSAFANHFDPKRKIRPADQARARAMLLRKSDLPPRYSVSSKDESAHLNCAPLDESDLTLKGEAASPLWVGGLTIIRSVARVYTSISDANVAWRRTTSAAGRACVATELERLAGANGGRLVSLKELPFARVTPRTVVYRIVFEVQAQGAVVQLTIDLVGLSKSRAFTYFLIASAAGPPSKAEEVRLARIVAARMATAMRGS